MPPLTALSNVPRYQCKYLSCQTTCSRRADMKRHEVQRHQSSKIFCPEAECKFRGTTRPAVLRKHLRDRHTALPDQEIEDYLVANFGGEDYPLETVFASDDVQSDSGTQPCEQSSLMNYGSGSGASGTSHDFIGYDQMQFPPLLASADLTPITMNAVSSFPQDLALQTYCRAAPSDHTMYNMHSAWNTPTPNPTNYPHDTAPYLNPASGLGLHEPVAFVNRPWQAPPPSLHDPETGASSNNQSHEIVFTYKP